MKEGLQEALKEAIAELSRTGFVSKERLNYWLTRVRAAAEATVGPASQVDQETSRLLGSMFDKLIDKGRISRYTPDITKFDIAVIRPQLRAELDRRIMAAADLIKLHRQEAVDRTLRRLSGWATSIPRGGDDTVPLRETRSEIIADVRKYKFERRRVDIDQSHKLVANIAHIVAMDNGAIAGIWHDHGEHDKSYNARKEHMERAGKYYAVRDSWAHKQGLINKGSGFTDDMTAPAQEISCRCWYQWVFALRRLPDSMLTKAGQEFLAQQRAMMEAA